MADERTAKVRDTRELDLAQLPLSLFSLFPPVHFNCRFKVKAHSSLNSTAVGSGWGRAFWASVPGNRIAAKFAPEYL